MEICFEGIGQVAATFRTENEKLAAGMAVTLTGDGEVGLGGEGKPLCGVTMGAARGGAAAVQIGGVVKVGYADGETFHVGCAALACDGEGKVTADGENGVSCLVLAVDEAENEEEDENKKSIVIKL